MNWMDRADKWLKQKYTDWRVAKNQRRQARQLARNFTEKIKLSAPAVAINDKLFREKLGIIDTLKKSVHTLLVETKGVIQKQPEAFERLREALYGVSPQAIHPAPPFSQAAVQSAHTGQLAAINAIQKAVQPDPEVILKAKEPRTPKQKECAAWMDICPPECPPCRSATRYPPYTTTMKIPEGFRTTTVALTSYFHTDHPGEVSH